MFAIKNMDLNHKLEVYIAVSRQTLNSRSNSIARWLITNGCANPSGNIINDRIRIMKIIYATEEHLDDLASLNIEVQKLHVGFEPAIFKKPDRDEILEFFRNALIDKNRKTYVCCNERQSVGYILLQIGGHEGHVFCYAQKWIYIDQIGVTREFRGKGVGKKLIEAAKDYARKHNINRIMLDVWSVNEDAKTFFEKQGFATFNERMRMKL